MCASFIRTNIRDVCTEIMGGLELTLGLPVRKLNFIAGEKLENGSVIIYDLMV